MPKKGHFHTFFPDNCPFRGQQRPEFIPDKILNYAKTFPDVVGFFCKKPHFKRSISLGGDRMRTNKQTNKQTNRQTDKQTLFY